MTGDNNTDLTGLIEAFHLMWDHFPGPSSLVHKTKKVIAANPACIAMGREPGMYCSRTGSPESHKGCLAAKALAEHRAERIQVEADGTHRAVFWLPVDGFDDYYIHFGVTMDAPQS